MCISQGKREKWSSQSFALLTLGLISHRLHENEMRLCNYFTKRIMFIFSAIVTAFPAQWGIFLMRQQSRGGSRFTFTQLNRKRLCKILQLPNLVNSKIIREAALYSVSLPLNHKIPPLRAIPNKSMTGGGNIVPDITSDMEIFWACCEYHGDFE